MALDNITNGEFDTALGTFHTATGLIYGGYTRVDSMPNQTPNSQSKIQCTSSVGTTPFYVSYEDLVNVDRAVRAIREAHRAVTGVNTDVYEMLQVFDVISDYANFVDTSNTWTDKEREIIMKSIRIVDFLAGQDYWQSYSEYPPGETGSVPTIDFATVDGTDGTATITPTITGVAHLVVYTRDDTGAVIHTASEANDDVNTAFTVDFSGAYADDIVCRVLGPGAGGVVVTHTETIAVTDV